MFEEIATNIQYIIHAKLQLKIYNYQQILPEYTILYGMIRELNTCLVIYSKSAIYINGFKY